MISHETGKLLQKFLKSLHVLLVQIYALQYIDFVLLALFLLANTQEVNV